MSAYKRLVSGPKPIGPLTPEELDTKLTRGRLYLTTLDVAVKIARTTGKAPYLVQEEDATGGSVQRTYATLQQLLESDLFDLSKFSYERK